MRRVVKSIVHRAIELSQTLQRPLRRFSGDENGISAVEFALLLPLMMSLYLGAVELSQAIAADRKVTLTARTISDLVAQVSSIDSSGISNSFNASTAVMAPYSVTNLKITVSSVSVDATGKATIAWSCSRNGTARTKGATVTLKSALAVPSTSLIWSEVSYAYTPVIGYVITGALTLSDQIYMRPRLSDTVSGPTSC